MLPRPALTAAMMIPANVTMPSARTKLSSKNRQRRNASTTSSNPTTTDRKSTRLNSSHSQISYADFCLKTKAGQPIRREHHRDNIDAPLDPDRKQNHARHRDAQERHDCPRHRTPGTFG